MSIGGFSRGLKGKNMYELLIILGVFAVWFLLQGYILPKMGVST